MSRVFLALPPNYCYTYDFFPLGTAMLAGYLKEKQVEVVQADYNLAYLRYWREKILADKAFEGLSVGEDAGVVQDFLNTLFARKKESGYYFSPCLPDRGDAPYSDISNSSFVFTERLLSCEHLFRYLEDEQENTFRSFFTEAGVISRIEEYAPDIVGLSIIAPSQVIAALTLGYIIKKNLPAVYVVVGGQWASLYREAIKNKPELRRCFDALIYFEGETPLYELATSLHQRRSLHHVPNLLYADDGGFVYSDKTSKENLDSLACPDFDGIALGEYCASANRGGIALTYQTARECYWNKCAYCVDLPLPKQGYRERSQELVLKDIEKLSQKYGMKHLEISNATISPRQFRELSRGIMANKLEVSWRCFARLDEGFTPEAFSLAKQAGCESILFGLESACQAVLDFVDKGIKMENVRRIIADCRGAGVNVILQMMMGLPSETTAQAMETIGFLVENRHLIHNATFNSYYLTPACQVYNNPGRYGIALREEPGLPFKFFQDFSHISGELDNAAAEALIQLYQRLLDKNSKNKKNDADRDYYRRAYRLSIGVGADSVSMIYDFDPRTKSGVLRETAQEASNV